MDDAANHTPGRSGLILLAHGSRDALWRQPIEAVHQLVQAMRPDLRCICAYLDACAPDLPAAAQSLIAQGVEHLIVLPLFLGTGKHAREDIPRLLDELRRQHPGCRFDLQTAAGENPRVTSLLAQLAVEAVEAVEAVGAAAGTEALKHTDFK